MTISIVLIILSLALFVYWFRYSCLLILRTRTAEDFATDVARAYGLSFEAVRGQIEAGVTTNISQLYELLERDYRIVNQMIDGLDSAAKDEGMMETHLLRLNFQFSRFCFRASSWLGLKSTASAMEEMADTICHFANSYGEWNSASARA